MRSIFSISLASLFLFSSLTFGSDKKPIYLCIADKSTGFYFEKGAWDTTRFNVKNVRYLIKEIDDEDKNIAKTFDWTTKTPEYGVYVFGNDSPRMFCDVNLGIFNCFQGVISSMYFDSETGRFLMTYNFGYWDGEDNNKNTPAMTIGKCSKL